MPIKITTKNQFLEGDVLNLPSDLFTARVIDIILDAEHPRAREFGGYDAVGIVFYENIEKDDDLDLGVARPLFSAIKQYPLINEIILVNNSVSKIFDKNINYTYTNYYLPIVNIWNHPHHNILPDIEINQTEDGNNVSYSEAENGLTNKPQREETISFGQYFLENSKIKPILPFEGDVILEGRFGNSIRFGSTNVNDGLGINPWSKDNTNENNGYPITIIKNGQSENLDKEGFLPTIEDINNDNSCMYLTSNQQLPLNPASLNQKSYGANLTEVKTPLQQLTSPKIDDTSEPEFTEDETVPVEEDIVTQSPPTTDIKGCTDPDALNFDSEATSDNGSCEYSQNNTIIETKTDILKLLSISPLEQYGYSGPEGLPEVDGGLNQPMGQYFLLSHLISSGAFKSKKHPQAVYEKYRSYLDNKNGDPLENFMVKDWLGFYPKGRGLFRTMVVKDSQNRIIYDGLSRVSKSQGRSEEDVYEMLINIAEKEISGAYTVDELSPPSSHENYVNPYDPAGDDDASICNNYPGVDGINGNDIVFNLNRVITKCIDPIIRNSPYMGAGIIIKSAYRSGGLSEKLGVDINGEHQLGQAIDFYVEGFNIVEVWEWCYANLSNWHQLLLAYPERGDGESWIHVSYTNENNRFTTLASKDKDLHNMFGGEKREPNSDYQDNIKPINT